MRHYNPILIINRWFWSLKKFLEIQTALQYKQHRFVKFNTYILFTDVGNELALPGFQITSNILDNGSEVDSPDDCQEKCIR